MLAHSHGSRFNSPLMGYLHALIRGASPPKYVLRSVDVGVVSVTTGDAIEGRLVLAASGVHDTTRGTRLRRKLCRDSHNSTASFLHLVGQDRRELVPASVEDGTVQSGFLPNIASGLRDGASRARGHTFGLQVFQNGDAEAIGDVERRSMMKVAADAGCASLHARYPLLCPLPPLRTSLAPTHYPLRCSLSGLNAIQAFGHDKHVAGRKRKCSGNSAINSNGIRQWLWGFVVYFTSNAYVPTSGVARYSRAYDMAANGPCATKLDPSNLWNPNRRPFIIVILRSCVWTFKPEAIVLTFSARSRKICAAPEEVFERFVQVAKNLMKAVGWNGADPVYLGSQLGNLRSLRRMVERPSSRPFVLPPPIASLFESNIVDKSAYAHHPPKLSFLLGGRLKLVSVCAMHFHAAFLASFVQQGEKIAFETTGA